MENTVDVCAYAKLSFIDGNCVIDKVAMEAFSQPKIWDHSCLDSQAETAEETTADTDMIIILGVAAGGISVLALFTYCGARFIQRIRHGNRGGDHSAYP